MAKFSIGKGKPRPRAVGSCCHSYARWHNWQDLQSNKIHHLKYFILQHRTMPPCYETSFLCLMEAFCWLIIWLVPYKIMSLPHTLCGYCGSKHPRGTPKFMATHLYVVASCFSGSVTSCSQDHFSFWGDTGKCPDLKNTFALLPAASNAVPWCPGLLRSGQAQSSAGFSPLISHCVHPCLVPQTNWF